MNIRKSFKKQNRNLDKMFSMRFRFLATVIFAMVAITIFIGGISLYEVDNYVQTQAEDFIKVTCDNEGTQIDDSLRNMEKSVKIMESYLMDFFKSREDVEDKALQEKVIKSADEMFVDVAKHTSTSGAVAYYFRFAPEIAVDGTSGLFYSKSTDSDEFTSFEPTDISIYDKDDIEHVGWYWQPYEAGKPIWMKPYHNQNNDMLMISYVIPMYFEEKFIGVVGMDFDYVVLSDMVHSIKLYENGFAHLEMDGEMICNDVHEEGVKNNANSKKYLRTSRKLVNGMTLVLSAKYDDIRRIRYDITLEILFVVIILLILFTVIAVIVVRKIVDPLNKLTDAAQKLSNGDYDIEIAESNTYEIKLLSAAFEDMAMRLSEREKLLHLSANRDSLTGLRNTTSYTAWLEKIDKEIDNANYAVAVLDINSLKETNDRYGHDVGNELIVLSAKIISEVFKRSPVFRIGGDEFLVVLRNKDLVDWEELFGKFEDRCKTTFIEKENAKIPVSIACGFAKFDSQKDSCFADVFKRADDAMYENKRKMKMVSI